VNGSREYEKRIDALEQQQSSAHRNSMAETSPGEYLMAYFAEHGVPELANEATIAGILASLERETGPSWSPDYSPLGSASVGIYDPADPDWPKAKYVIGWSDRTKPPRITRIDYVTDWRGSGPGTGTPGGGHSPLTEPDAAWAGDSWMADESPGDTSDYNTSAAESQPGHIGDMMAQDRSESVTSTPAAPRQRADAASVARAPYDFTQRIEELMARQRDAQARLAALDAEQQTQAGQQSQQQQGGQPQHYNSTPSLFGDDLTKRTL
jgi:hypothetical protein